MKFNLRIPLRNIIFTLIFMNIYFNANAVSITLCVRLPPNSIQEEIDNYNSGAPQPNLWKFSIDGYTNDASSYFSLPVVINSNTDYCTPSIPILDQAIPFLPGGNLAIHEYINGPQTPYGMDPIAIPIYALIAYKNCKIELYGNGSHINSRNHFTYSLTASGLIQCNNFPENSAVSSNKLKNSISHKY